MDVHAIAHGVMSVPLAGEAWHDFYLLAGTAAVTLVGLLFVSLSLHVEILFRPEHGDFREMAAQAFQGYLYVLVSALIFLVPMANPVWQLSVFGFLNLVMLVRAALRIPAFVRAQKLRGANKTHHGRRFPLPFVAYVLGMLAVYEGLKESTGSALTLLAPMIMMPSAATRTAWDVLEYVGKTRAAAQDPAADR